MDVTGVAWRKSSYSGDNGGTCVEVGTFGPAVAIRDSNHPDGLEVAHPLRTLCPSRCRSGSWPFV